ncbi:hypothetical protein DVP96_13305 [Yersinia enterocolitica]|nr:hypothetical protein [Yersinia enterocolitica]
MISFEGKLFIASANWPGYSAVGVTFWLMVSDLSGGIGSPVLRTIQLCRNDGWPISLPATQLVYS